MVPHLGPGTDRTHIGTLVAIYGIIKLITKLPEGRKEGRRKGTYIEPPAGRWLVPLCGRCLCVGHCHRCCHAADPLYGVHGSYSASVDWMTGGWWNLSSRSLCQSVGSGFWKQDSQNTTFPQHERSEAERVRGPQRMR